MEKRKKKWAKIRKGDPNSGVYLDSIVTSPAIRSGFVALSSEEVDDKNQPLLKVSFSNENSEQLKFTADKKQKILVGPLLIPNIPIGRKDKKTGELYDLYFTAEDIVEINRQRMKLKLINNFNVEHKFKISELINEQMWIVSDRNNDKANALGNPQDAGTLMTVVYVEDDAAFEYLSENFTGFSIEGYFDLFEEEDLKQNFSQENIINNNINKAFKMKEKGFFASFFSMKAAANKIKLADYPLQDGRTLIVDDNTGKAAIDGQVPANGDYVLADGSVAVIVDGNLSTINDPMDMSKQNQNTKMDTNTQTQNPAANTPAPGTPALDQTQFDALKAELEGMKKTIAELTTAKTNLETEKTKLSEEKVKLEADKVKLEEEKTELSKKVRAGSPVDVLNSGQNSAGTKAKLSQAELAVDRLNKIQEMMK